jgi:hypothetical protein
LLHTLAFQTSHALWHHLSAYLPTCLSVCLPTCLSAYLSICLQYEYLCLKLKGKNTRRKWKFPKTYFQEPSQCPLPHLGARTLLTFQGAGQRFDWGLLPPPAATLNATMHRLRPVDIVVFNVGECRGVQGVKGREGCGGSYMPRHDTHTHPLLLILF